MIEVVILLEMEFLSLDRSLDNIAPPRAPAACIWTRYIEYIARRSPPRPAAPRVSRERAGCWLLAVLAGLPGWRALGGWFASPPLRRPMGGWPWPLHRK